MNAYVVQSIGRHEEKKTSEDGVDLEGTANSSNSRASIHDNANTNSLIREAQSKRCKLTYWVLMILSGIGLLVGGSSATLLGRVYFVHGGSRRWVYTCIQSIGWPILLLPLAISSYWVGWNKCGFKLTPKLLLILSLMGFLTTLDNLLYAWGTSYLPVSTTSLLCSTQLGFSAVFSYFFLLQRNITPFTLNSVFLIITSAGLLGVGDQAHAEPILRAHYVRGYLVTIAASALFALILTLLQIIYVKVIGKTSFVIVLQVQVFISLAATLFAMLGMWVKDDFHGIMEEAQVYNLGRGLYGATLIGAAIGWQIYILGGAGIVFLSSSFLSCVFMTAIIPILPLLGVLFLHDTFSIEKAISILLSVWGFASYVYGGYLKSHPQQSNLVVDVECH